MKKFIAALCVFSALGAGALVAQEKGHGQEYPATQTEVYALDKLADDGKQLVDAENRVKQARALHEAHLKAFVFDAARSHSIALKAGETLGWSPESKSFYVTSDGTSTTAQPMASPEAAPVKSAP